MKPKTPADKLKRPTTVGSGNLLGIWLRICLRTLAYLFVVIMAFTIGAIICGLLWAWLGAWTWLIPGAIFTYYCVSIAYSKEQDKDA